MNLADYLSLGERHRSKYRNIPTVLDGIKFMSKREAGHYSRLKMQERAGEVRNIRRQVPFILQDKFSRHGTIIQPIKYLCDFLVDEKMDGVWREVVIDVKASKSFADPVYLIKRKMFFYKYPELIFREIYD